MSDDDFDVFAGMLDDVAELRQLPPLSPRAKVLFFDAVRRYPLALVERAIQAHLIDPDAGRYRTMVQPAHIVAQIEGAVASDGRPEADEAWAISLRASDEAATVVWTGEIAAAFEAARPVLEAGDEVGARMAFKAAYARIVAEARAAGAAPRWVASLGHDPAQRTDALQLAVAQGMLPAPHVQALLPAPEVSRDDMSDAAAAANLARIRRMLAGAVSPGERRRQAASDSAARERARIDALKAQTAARVAQHQEAAR